MRHARVLYCSMMTVFFSASAQSSQIWTPEEMTNGNIVAWYDASMVSTLTTNASGVVSEWRDRSTNAWHLTNSSVDARPMSGVQINGLHAVQFDAVDDQLKNTSFNRLSGSQNRMVFLVVDAPSTGRPAAFFDTGANGSGGRWTSSKYSIDFNQAIHSWSAPASDPSKSLYMNALNGSFASDAECWANGSQLVTSSTANPSTAINTLPDLYLGRAMNANHDPNVERIIGECLVINTYLSSEDRQLIEGYLAWKWGLESNLPTDHDWRYRPPGPPPGTVIKLH